MKRGKPPRRGKAPRRYTPLAPGRPPPPISPRRAEKRAARGVRGPLCTAARDERRCWLCQAHVPEGCHPHHVRRVGPGWGDWLYVLSHPRYVDTLVRPSRSSLMLAASARVVAYDLMGSEVELHGNVCPCCGECHNACHVVPGYEAARCATLRAYEFGLAHAELAS